MLSLNTPLSREGKEKILNKKKMDMYEVKNKDEDKLPLNPFVHTHKKTVPRTEITRHPTYLRGFLEKFLGFWLPKGRHLVHQTCRKVEIQQ